MLYELFYECLNINYKNIGLASNYATRREKEKLYIFFEHSRGCEDWKNNLDFPVSPYRKTDGILWKAHRGFLKAWKDIEPALSESVNDKSIEEISVTGYSHGAAIALLCYEYAVFHRPELGGRIKGYGFGCPRVLWGRKTEGISKKFKTFTVIRNIDDIVTHLPPAFLGYYHVGTLISIGKKGKYSTTDAHRPENILTELEIYERNNTSRLIPIK